MVSFIINYFKKHTDDEEKIRSIYGFVCGITGIILNVILFVLKLVIGTISNSISITADAFNNLTDAGSSVVTVFGFLFSAKKADDEHPFGHGRIEYLSAMLISVVIMLVGAELLKSSVGKIINPQSLVFNNYISVILILSIAIKLYMALYNSKYAKEIKSSALKASAADSLSDCVATSAVLVSAIFANYTDIAIDGYVGAIVSILILKTGITSLIETSQPLLGKAPDSDFVNKISDIVNGNPETVGIHDLVVHDYGPDKIFVSLHMEVDGSKDMFVVHDAVDLVEKEIEKQLGCEAIIHMDPIDMNNEILVNIKEKLDAFVCKEKRDICIHDIRMVPGPTHTNIIFDVALPPQLFKKRDLIENELEQIIKSMNKNYYAVIKSEIMYS